MSGGGGGPDLICWNLSRVYVREAVEYVATG